MSSKPATETSSGARCSDSFVLRIWRENDRAQWQGWIQHARTGESAFVQEMEGLLAFIENRTGTLTRARPEGIR